MGADEASRKKLILGAVIGATILGSPTGNAGPMTVVAFGASTTAKRTNVVVYADQLPNRIGSGRLNILNKGVPGNTTQAARERFQRDVLDQRPEVVIIQFGINDSAVDVWRDPPKALPRVSLADFEKNIRHFVRESKAVGAEVILMTPNQLRWSPRTLELYGKPPYNRDDPMGFNLLLPQYCEVIRKIALNENVKLVDVYAAYDDPQRTGGKTVEDLLPDDGMHPNTEGHSLVADGIEPLLRDVLAKRKTPAGN